MEIIGIFRRFTAMLRLCTLLGLCATMSIANAVPTTGVFSADGFTGGGTLSGEFEGTDDNSNDLLDLTELDEFNLSYTGGSVVGLFALDLLDNLGGTFSYDMLNDALYFALYGQGDDNQKWALYVDPFFQVDESGPPLAEVGQDCEEGEQVCANIDVNYAPEPGSLGLVALALLSLGWRRRPGVPDHEPGVA